MPRASDGAMVASGKLALVWNATARPQATLAPWCPRKTDCLGNEPINRQRTHLARSQSSCEKRLSASYIAVRMEQPDSHRTDFHEIRCWRHFLKYVDCLGNEPINRQRTHLARSQSSCEKRLSASYIPVRTEQPDSHRTDFHEIRCWRHFLKYVEKFKFLLKVRQSNTFLWRPTYIYNYVRW